MSGIVNSNAQPPSVVAEQILWLRNDGPTTPMHVIKLVYLCHGWMLGIHDQCLITEAAEAWQYGPVVPSVYHRYKSFRGDAITGVHKDHSSELNRDQCTLIADVLDAYRGYDALALSAITHQPDTPWAKVYEDGRGAGAIIPNELIRDHYKQRANA